MPKPAIFLAFANSRKDLPQLEEERIELYNLLEPYFQIIQKDRATLPRIEDSFRIHGDQIRIFHFAGHADSKHLEMSEGKGIAYVEGIARFVGRQGGVELAFLNGCSTRGQIEAFFKSGVPAVIATEAAVRDEVAKEFSLLFYNNFTGGEGNTPLEDAFEDAKAQLRSRYEGAQMLKPPSSRDRQSNSGMDTDEVPYILRTAGRITRQLTYKDLCESAGPISKSKVPPEAHLLCDREDPNQEFEEFVIEKLENVQRNPMMSLLYGEERELPLKLCERFSTFTLKKSIEKLDRKWDESIFLQMDIRMPLLGDYKREHRAMDLVKERLLDGFHLENYSRRKTRELQAADLISGISSHIKIVLVKHLLYVQDWHPVLSPVFMQHYLQNFWNIKLTGDQPDILLLFALQYPNSKGIGGLLRKKGVHIPHHFASTQVLSKLLPVPRIDVKRWNDLYAPDDPELTNLIFRSSKRMPMKDIISELKATVDRLRS